MHPITKSGFSLIELIVVMAIIGILSTISYPIYNQHMIKVRRNHMAITLLSVAGRMEEYYVQHSTYEGATLDNLAVSKHKYDKYYSVGISSHANSYMLMAKPIGRQAQDECGTLMLDHIGSRNASGERDDLKCW